MNTVLLPMGVNPIEVNYDYGDDNGNNNNGDRLHNSSSLKCDSKRSWENFDI
jgi:hypothetical protein